VGLSVGGGIMLCIAGQGAALSFLMAAGLVLVSMISVALVLRVMFLKKNIALLVVVIVFKWPILIYILLLLLKNFEVEALGFSLGTLAWVPSTLAWHFIANRE